MNIFDEWGQMKAAIAWCEEHHGDVFFRAAEGVQHVTVRAGKVYAGGSTFADAVIKCKGKYDREEARMIRRAKQTSAAALEARLDNAGRST